MSRHHKIDYLEFQSSDIAVTKAFFSEVFGWQYTDYGDDYVAFHGAGIEGGFFKSDCVSQSQGSAPAPIKKKPAPESVTPEPPRSEPTPPVPQTTIHKPRATSDKRPEIKPPIKEVKTNSQRKNEILDDPAVKTVLIGLDATITAIEED